MAAQPYGYIGSKETLSWDFGCRDGWCDPAEKEHLKKYGLNLTKHFSTDDGNWTNVVTVQASSYHPAGKAGIDDELLTGIGKNIIFMLKRMIEKRPTQVKDMLDFCGGNINVTVVWGSGNGLSGLMAPRALAFKRNGAQDGGVQHEFGHFIDLSNNIGPDGKVTNQKTILAQHDADYIDSFVGRAPEFMGNKDEFLAETYHDMYFQKRRDALKARIPEVHTRLSWYVPAVLPPYRIMTKCYGCD